MSLNRKRELEINYGHMNELWALVKHIRAKKKKKSSWKLNYLEEMKNLGNRLGEKAEETSQLAAQKEKMNNRKDKKLQVILVA